MRIKMQWASKVDQLACGPAASSLREIRACQSTRALWVVRLNRGQRRLISAAVAGDTQRGRPRRAPRSAQELQWAEGEPTSEGWRKAGTLSSRRRLRSLGSSEALGFV